MNDSCYDLRYIKLVLEGMIFRCYSLIRFKSDITESIMVHVYQLQHYHTRSNSASRVTDSMTVLCVVDSNVY